VKECNSEKRVADGEHTTEASSGSGSIIGASRHSALNRQRDLQSRLPGTAPTNPCWAHLTAALANILDSATVLCPLSTAPRRHTESPQ
jgi:hypothetical protein